MFPTTTQRRRLTRLAAAAAAFVVFLAVNAAQLYSASFYDKTPYHTSSLTGYGWLQELIHGHPDRIKSELGMTLPVFRALVEELRKAGLKDTRYITIEEHVAIFLYRSVTGLSIHHVGERLQRAKSTISKSFTRVLCILSSPPFYTAYVHLPMICDEVPTEIQSNPKFFPFFEGAIGAMDGTHINCCPSSEEQQLARDRKGGVSQNTLACCGFDLRFQYILSGWDGCAADASMYNNARLFDLPIPAGKYYLADAGFGLCDSLLVPYRGIRYHLAEWGRAAVRPVNKQELYNLRHASARNVVERIFGILKRRFKILIHPPEQTMDIQARIPPALAALHNFIRDHDQNEILDFDVQLSDPDPGLYGLLAEGPARQPELIRATAKRDEIASAMWASYQKLTEGMGLE